jgi:hypothetical protein
VEADDFWARWELTSEKFEVYKGKLFWHENDRINLLEGSSGGSGIQPIGARQSCSRIGPERGAAIHLTNCVEVDPLLKPVDLGFEAGQGSRELDFEHADTML